MEWWGSVRGLSGGQHLLETVVADVPLRPALDHTVALNYAEHKNVEISHWKIRLQSRQFAVVADCRGRDPVGRGLLDQYDRGAVLPTSVTTPAMNTAATCRLIPIEFDPEEWSSS